MDYLETVVTATGRDHAWAALTDVTSYPRWTASMTSVEPLDGPVLAVGNRFRVRQPGLPVNIWQVREVREGESYVWEARALGVRTVAYHRLASEAGGATRISIGIRQTGLLAGLVALLISAKTRRYVRLEAAGL
ncbi:SRPBCC family protein, partial [Micromonospora azadirachtae]